jgi:hypothetical protein
VKAATLTQFLIDVTRGHRKAEFAADPDAVLAASPLEEAMRTAVRSQDIGALWNAGAHPMALMYFARGCGWANDRYYRCISEAALRTGDRADAAPPAPPAPAQTHPPSARHGP